MLQGSEVGSKSMARLGLWDGFAVVRSPGFFADLLLSRMAHRKLDFMGATLIATRGNSTRCNRLSLAASSGASLPGMTMWLGTHTKSTDLP